MNRIYPLDPPRISALSSLGGSGRSAILFQNTHEVLLLLVGLEATVTELGSGIDQSQSDLFGGNSLGLGDERLADVEDALPDADARAFDHDEVLLHHTVVREATHGIDGLLGDVLLSSTVALNELSVLHVESVSDAVNLLVDLGSVMITLLTDTSHRVGDSGRMPGSDTGDLAKTLVSLARQLLHMPTGNNTFNSVTLSDSDDINHLILGKDIFDRNRLLHESAGEIHFLGDRAAVQLDLVNVGLLLALAEELDLGVGDDTDDGAVFLHLAEILFDLLFAIFGRPFLGIFGEGLLLGGVPVLVEAASDLLGEMLGPDGLEGPHAVGSFDVADDSDDHDGRRLDERHRLNHFLLVRLGSRTIHQAADVGHTSLVASEGGKMNRLLGVILGEALDSSLVVLAPLLGQESQVAVTRSGKFTVRHRLKLLKICPP